MNQEHNLGMGNQTKVTIGAAAGAASLLIIWGANQLGLSIPAEVAAALTVVITAAVSYIKQP